MKKSLNELAKFLKPVSDLYVEDKISAKKLQDELQSLGGGNNFSGPFDGSRNLAYDGAMARTGYAGEFRATLLQAMKFFETEEMLRKDGIEGGGLVVVGGITEWREKTENEAIPDNALSNCVVYFDGVDGSIKPFIYRLKQKIKQWKFLEKTKKDEVYKVTDNAPWDR